MLALEARPATAGAAEGDDLGEKPAADRRAPDLRPAAPARLGGPSSLQKVVH